VLKYPTASETGLVPAEEFSGVFEKPPLQFPNSTLTLLLLLFATTRSRHPSQSKSCVAMAKGAAHVEIHGSLKCAVTVAEKHADAVASAVGHRQVHLAIVIEVADFHGSRTSTSESSR
jgi:hypothetical protein